MTSTIDYTTVSRDAQSAITGTLESWKETMTSFANQFSSLPTLDYLPQYDATEAVERYFGFVKQVIDLNHEYARSIADATDSFAGLARKQLESVSEAVRDQVESVSTAALSQVDTVEQAVRDQVDQAEQVAKDEAKKVAAAERAAKKNAHAEARAEYEGMTKAELSEELASRDLPKSGNVDELIERLVEHDTK